MEAKKQKTLIIRYQNERSDTGEVIVTKEIVIKGYAGVVVITAILIGFSIFMKYFS